VVYSATKHIDGQGRCLGGVILGSEKFIQDNIHQLIRQTGPSLSPFNAWVLLKKLETLAVRVRRQTDTAATIAVALAEHPKITRLIYPGRPDHPQAEVARRQMQGARRWSHSRSTAARRRRSASRTRSSWCASATISATPRA
jgi:O-succinylhomoserine sulfhydrylase